MRLQGYARNMADGATMSFVVFSDDWGEHPSSCQHLFRHIIGRYPVLWLNTLGMRTPTLTWSDLRKAYRKLARMVGGGPSPGAPAAGPRPTVCQPFMLPFTAVAGVRSLNRFSVVRAVRKAGRALDLRSPIVVSTVPNACDYVSGLNAAKVVYYCVDDFSTWPGLQHDLVRRMESQLIGRTDVLLATSQHLYRRLAATGKPVHLLTHGVDLDLFSQEASAEHECLREIPRPRVGYFGLFDERSDQELIAALAARMPEVAFVIAGPVVTDVERLRRLANIHFTGPVRYERLPALIRGLGALIIPYAVNEASNSISPLKMKEYLATGRPVVSTPLAEALLQRPHVTVAASVDEWQAALTEGLSVDIAARRRVMLEVLRGESWVEKAATFLDICAGGAGNATGAAA